jgi:TusA-related sulfurtransferase
MSNVNAAWDIEWDADSSVDDALAGSERIQTEEGEEKRHKATKNSLPYSEPLALEICERISSGELLIVICDDPHMPTVRRVRQWLRENNLFAALDRSIKSCNRLASCERSSTTLYQSPSGRSLRSASNRATASLVLIKA